MLINQTTWATTNEQPVSVTPIVGNINNKTNSALNTEKNKIKNKADDKIGTEVNQAQNKISATAAEDKAQAKNKINIEISTVASQSKNEINSSLNEINSINNQMKNQINSVSSYIHTPSQQINAILEKQQEKECKSKGSPVDLGWVINIALTVVGSMIIEKGDINGLLTAIKLAGIMSIHLIGIDGQYIQKAVEDPSHYNALKAVIKKAAHPYLPHIYLAGAVKPEYIDDMIKLTRETGAIYETGKTPINLIVSSIDKYVSPKQRINISIVSLPDITIKSEKLNYEIVQVLPRINFMSVNENYINIQHVRNTLKVYHYNKLTHKTVLREIISIAHFSSAQISSKIHDVIKNYREGKINNDMKNKHTLYKKRHHHRSYTNRTHSKNTIKKTQENTNDLENTDTLESAHRVNRRR